MVRTPPPGVGSASSTSTRSPAWARTMAAARPFGPEPTTHALRLMPTIGYSLGSKWTHYLLFSQLLEEAADGFDAVVEVGDVELLVGGVEVVVGEAEAHHHAGNFQHVLKVGDDGNRAAAANEDRIFLEGVVQGFGGGFDVGIVGADHGGRTLAPDFDGGFDALGRELLHKGRVLFQDVIGILVGDEAHGNFRGRLRGDHRLGAGGDEASGHAVDFERGARPGAVEDGVAGLSGERFRSDFGFAVVLFVEGQALPGFEFVFGWSLHTFIEAGDQDFALGVLQLADDFDEGKERIGGCAAIHAGVQVGLGAPGFDFGVDQAAQADTERGKIGREEFGVAD